MNFHLEYEKESDGRWLAEVPEIPGVLAYGITANEAMAKAEILALRVLAERIESEESLPKCFFNAWLALCYFKFKPNVFA